MINGRYDGETGLVMNVEEDVLSVFGDLALKEFKVFIKDVQAATEVASGLDSIGQYSLHDMVQLEYVTSDIIVTDMCKVRRIPV